MGIDFSHHSNEKESSKDNEEEGIKKEGKEIKEVTKIDAMKQPSESRAVFAFLILPDVI
ncbi:MAG: hypothetical protein AAB610_02865 [Patescibacteria group bacterium]